MILCDVILINQKLQEAGGEVSRRADDILQRMM
jgi:hypothetical protein